MSNKKKPTSTKGRLARLAGYLTLAGAALSLTNKRVRTFVGSKLVPVAQFIPGQVAKRKNKDAGK